MSGYSYATPQGTVKFYDDDCPMPKAVTSPYTIQWLLPIYYPNGPTPMVQFNLQQLITQNQIKGVQSVYIDNSACTQPVAIVDSTGISQIVPALGQAYLPVRYTTAGNLTINLAGPGNLGPGNDAQYGETTVSFLNYKTDLKIWNAKNLSAAGQFESEISYNYNASFGVRQDGEIVDVWGSGNQQTPVIVGNSCSQLSTRTFNANSAPNGVVITEITGGWLEIQNSTYTQFGGYLSILTGTQYLSGTQQLGQYNFAFETNAVGNAIYQLPAAKVSMYMGPEPGDFGIPGEWTNYGFMCVNPLFSTPGAAGANFLAIIQAKGKIL